MPAIRVHRRPPRHCARLAALATLLCGSAAAAGWGGLLGVGTDIVQRGSSLTDGRPGWLADLHYVADDDWVAGVAANAERPPMQSAGAQLTAYLDRRWRLDRDWSAKLGVVHYESPWNRWSRQLRYNEVNAALGWRGRWRLALTLSADSPGLSANWDVRRDFVAYVESSYSQPLGGPWSAHVGVGHADLRRVSDRSGGYASLGLGYALGDAHVYSMLFWTDRGAQAYATPPDQGMRWVTSLVWSF